MKKSLVYALLIVFALGMTAMACKKAEEAAPAEPAATEEAAPAEATDTMEAEESASPAPEMMEEGEAMEGEAMEGEAAEGEEAPAPEGEGGAEK